MTNLLTCITPDWIEPGAIAALSSTRLGGVSEHPYHGLNLGRHVSDDKTAVDENRRLFRKTWSLPSEPVWLNQVHGADIEVITNSDQQTSLDSADGAWTNVPGKVIGVLTADCLPVVIADRAGRELAVVHAGWRGLVAGVLGSALEKFSKGLQLQAWFGPAIGPAAFEVGEEVRTAFVERSVSNASAFVSTENPGKYMADLYQLAERELKNAGDIRVFGGSHCTVTESALFHSYRRDGAASGRMATVAWIAP